MLNKLTVCGVSRLGYGDAQGKVGGDAMKERIGDALRNSARRFGAALDLWHKGDLHADDGHEEAPHQGLPWYDSFDNDKAGMVNAIQSGKRTTDQILANLSKSYRLDADTEEKIKQLGIMNR